MAVKSVPRTDIVAVGVLTATFCGVDFAICPLAYRTVPSAILAPNFPPLVLGSYTKSSIT